MTCQFMGCFKKTRILYFLLRLATFRHTSKGNANYCRPVPCTHPINFLGWRKPDCADKNHDFDKAFIKSFISVAQRYYASFEQTDQISV